MDFGPLRKILELEHSKGYANTAVIGGLDRFLQNWSGPAMASISNRRLLSRFRKLGLTNPDYASLTTEQRQQWVAGVLNLIEEVQAGAEKKSAARTTTKTVRQSQVSRQSRQVAGSLDSPITVVKGISASTATRFEKLGARTVRDLLYFFPHRHLDYSQVKTISQLTEGEE